MNPLVSITDKAFISGSCRGLLKGVRQGWVLKVALVGFGIPIEIIIANAIPRYNVKQGFRGRKPLEIRHFEENQFLQSAFSAACQKRLT